MKAGIKDLEPEGGSLESKFNKNHYSGTNGGRQSKVALRITRVNHACRPNADTIYDETALVAILFAQKDILPGQEISICYYTPYFGLLTILSVPGMNSGANIEEEFHSVKNGFISPDWNTCPADCSCHDPAIRILVQEGRLLHQETMKLHYQLKTEQALAVGDKLLDIHRRLDVSWIYYAYTATILFRIAVCKLETLPRAMQYVQSVVDLYRNICPYSEKRAKKFEKLLEHPETHPDYLLIDKLMNNTH